MEEEMETIQKRIDELNAELKLLDEQCGKRFVPYQTIGSRLRCQCDLLDLEYEQGRLRREQERVSLPANGFPLRTMHRKMKHPLREMTQKRTSLPCYSEASGRRGTKTVSLRARAYALASNIPFMHNGMMGHRPCNFVLLGAKATVFGSIVMAMKFPPFSTETR